MTPPAIAPTFRPELAGEDDELTVVVVEPLATHSVRWQVVQDGGMSEQTSSAAHTGQEGAVLGHETQPRRKMDSYETVAHQYNEGETSDHTRRTCTVVGHVGHI
jgi:hypothetical protein